MKKILLLFITFLSISAFANNVEQVGDCQFTDRKDYGVSIYLYQGNIFNGVGVIDTRKVLGNFINITFSKGYWKYQDPIEQLVVYSDDGRTGFSGWNDYLGSGYFFASIDGRPAKCKIFWAKGTEDRG